MVKEDWKILQKNKNGITFKNKENNLLIFLNDTGFGWTINIGMKYIDEVFKTKKDALAYAKNYMKNN